MALSQTDTQDHPARLSELSVCLEVSFQSPEKAQVFPSEKFIIISLYKSTARHRPDKSVSNHLCQMIVYFRLFQQNFQSHLSI